MILHKYICKNVGSWQASGECCTFYTAFEPTWSAPFCPNCGADEKVEYLGESEILEVEKQ